jgi:uncharacterized protein (DUF885 family)
MFKAVSTASALALLLALAPASGLAQGAPTPTAGAPTASSAVLAGVIADYETFARRDDPITAGTEGDREALRRLPDVTPEADRARLAALQGFKARLAAIDPAGLSENERLNRTFLARVVDDRIEGLGFDDARLGFTSEGGWISALGYIASTTPIRNRDDAEAWLARLEAAPKLLADSTANARRGIRTGFVQPRPTVEFVLAQTRGEIAVPIDDDALLKPFEKLPDTIPAADQAAYRARARTLIETKIRPEQRAFLAMVEREYLPKARKGLGVGSLPGGQTYYAYLARHYTTTALTPAQIHQIGLDEVARIRAEMDAIIREVGFKGSFAEFLQFLRTDPQFYATSRQDLLEKASEIAKRIDDKLPGEFGTLPRLTYGVRPVPKEIEENYTTGRYFQGSPKLGVAGGYMVNTSHLDQRPLYELPALTLHEAVPGHHLQIALTQELGDQPWFRRNADLTAYTEGWGLYSEFLGYDLGTYRTPYERFGKLSYEMWRACRLVADTGVHAMGWSLEQARACFRDNSALAPHNIETELQRYVSWPGQALGYKIGELKLRALRKRAETALGPDFDVRAFHDTVLLGGPLPLDLLEARIDGWIAERKAATASK